MIILQEKISIAMIFLVLAICILAVDTYADAPEAITGDDVISVQVSGGIEGVSSPFIVPGESLISLITDMVDFESEGTNIVFHRPTGKLFVKNSPENILLVESVIEELRSYVADEVLIEARIIEISAFDGSDIGIELGRFGYDIGLPGVGKGSLGITGNSVGSRGARGGIQNFGAGAWSDNNTLGTQEEFNILGFIDTTQFDLDVVLRTLKQTVELNTLSAPRISCFNNQRANIQITRTEAYISDYDAETSTTGDNQQVVRVPVVSEAQEGIVLDITPTISKDRKFVYLEFHPVVIDLELTEDEITLDGDPYVIFYPNFTMRSVDTTVSIPDGGTVVIGGLMSREEKDDVRKVPILGDIPLIGNLFKTRTKYDEKTNLLFFITAKIKAHSETKNF